MNLIELKIEMNRYGSIEELPTFSCNHILGVSASRAKKCRALKRKKEQEAQDLDGGFGIEGDE